jgi:pyrimidine operon attenuation protein / uracil phosphoribosyltransferase
VFEFDLSHALPSSPRVTEAFPVPREPLLDAAGVERCLDAIAHSIRQTCPQEPNLQLVGIHRRGVPFAKALAARLWPEDPQAAQARVGCIDITQHRDDLSNFRGVLPQLEGSHLPFDLDEAIVILCDEVIYTARTTRAALEELLDFGRPRRVHIAALIDRAGRHFPLHADYAGLRIDLPEEKRVSVRFMESDGRDEVFTTLWENKNA